MKPKTTLIDITNSSASRFPLFDTFLGMWEKCRPAFVENRTHELGLTLALGLLSAFGRRTISRGICARALQHLDWSRFYRFFSKDIWFPIVLTHQLLTEVAEHIGAGIPLVIGVDDTTVDKTGKTIPASGYFYDSKSPPWARSYKWALRFITISALLTPYGPIAAARGILIKLKLAPTLKKPAKNASDEEQRQYRHLTRDWSITTQLVEQLHLLRAQMDAIAGLAERLLVIVADGSYTNKTVMGNLPERSIFIGRTRKDIEIYEPAGPRDGSRRGRAKRYGRRLPTPDDLRKDDTIPYQTCRVFAAGRWHDLRYKTLAPVLWKSVGSGMPLRLIIIAPLAYRLSRRSKLLYRRPAYLLVSDPNYPIHLAIQHYFHRWEIEVNHRDAKQNFGLGQAQVRHPRSVARQTSFVASIYSMLSLASLDAYGPSRTENYAPRPKWRNDPRSRPSALDLATQLRIELWSHESGGQLTEFLADPVLAPNATKYVENAQAWLAQTVPKGLSLTAWSAIIHADA
jgi:hypothetical protein